MIADAHERFRNEKVNGNDRARVPVKKNAEARRATGNVRVRVLADVTPKNSLHGPATGGDPSTSIAPDFDLAQTSIANVHGHVVLKSGPAAASGAASDQISPKLAL